MDDRALEILLVEDDPGEARLIAEAFKETKSPHRIIHLVDGEQGLAYLKTEGAFRNASPPAIILLDLNLPGVNGHQVLAEVKTNAQLRRIPIIVFSNSQAEEDIRKANDLCANCYVSKPSDLEGYLNSVKIIEEFWLQTAKLPLA